jgi:lipoprotein-anchoring transpeptidase ErfK/SrfK
MRAVLGTVWVIGLACALVFVSAPAMAESKTKSSLKHKAVERVVKEPESKIKSPLKRKAAERAAKERESKIKSTLRRKAAERAATERESKIKSTLKRQAAERMAPERESRIKSTLKRQAAERMAKEPGSKIKSTFKHKAAERVPTEPFGTIPKGPLQIIISINQQELHLYSNGTHVADVPVATGVPDHPTPLGVFSVIEKDRYHESNIYSSAPMPYMQRITWSGVAIHEGVGVGHPASHGCVRIPREFAARLWVLTRRGARVIIARSELRPEEFADPALFVRKEKPPAPAAETPATVEAVKTAETVDGSKTTDIAATSTSPEPTGGIPTAVPPAAPSAPADDHATDPPAAAGDTKPNDAGKPAAWQIKPALDAALETVPMPFPKPADIAKAAPKKGRPIAIFVSRKTSKIYVRQNFEPLFEAPIAIEHREQPLGTHVFTAMQSAEDDATVRWTVISLPGEQVQAVRDAEKKPKKPEKNAKGKRERESVTPRIVDVAPPQTPHEALARIEIPPDVVERISALIVPGSSLVVSDQGLGEETGEGTDFIVVTR